MKFINEISVGDIVSIITMLLALVGGAFGLYQWNETIRTKRAEYINELTLKIRTDDDIRDIVYLLDYNEKKWYTIDFHGSGELERKIDKTLSYFSYICYLKQKHLINNSDFMFFKYEIERILANNQVINYFYNLYHFSRKNYSPLTFYYLFEYGERNKMFDKGFYNKNSKKYPHFLIF